MIFLYFYRWKVYLEDSGKTTFARESSLHIHLFSLPSTWNIVQMPEYAHHG